MPASFKNPSISIVIPTLNAAAVLRSCLKSIISQHYPKKLIEIIIADGGSTDDTIGLAKKFKCVIISNPLQTGESGKAIGVKNAKGKYIALIDSDNILPTSNWLKTMIKPLEINTKLIGSEPWKYTYRPSGGFIERYSALTGVNDPYALISNIYDRKNYLRKSWTGLKLPIVNHRYYQIVTLKPNSLLPTIGANGTIFRSTFLKPNIKSNYLIDVDIITAYLKQSKTPIYFAKIKTGIIHTFCESSIKKFYKKQLRRVTDLYVYKSMRIFPQKNTHLLGSLKFTLYVILIFPMLFDTLKGYLKKPDLAWFFHPLACWITLYTYSLGTIKSILGILKPINRQQWQQ